MTFDLNADINTPIARPTHQWSPFQSAIFEAIETTRANIIVEAVAGSGKTTTIIEAAGRAKATDFAADIIMLAFNKAIATELQSRVPAGVMAKTFHSLGLATFRGQRPRINGGKIRGILKNLMKDDDYREYSGDIVRMISLIKANALLAPEPEDWLAAMSDFGIFCPGGMERSFVAWAAQAHKTSLQDTREIDFDDMLYLPVLNDHRFPKFDIVFVDEAQDLSPIQHEIVKRILAPGARVIAVGDTQQAIYSFRGADSDSMNKFRAAFSPTELPLSISYRCPHRVVDEAQRYVEHIQPFQNAKDGIVQRLDEFPYPFEDMGPQDLIICRNNAPLFRIGLQFLSRQLPVTVMGNFGDRLVSFIKSFKTKDIAIFKQRIDQWFEIEHARLMEAEQYSKAGQEEDKYECVTVLLEHSKSVDEMLELLNRLCLQGDGAIVSSVHRAKGREALRVYIYNPSLIPSRYAKSKAQIHQELNLLYVAITRSKSELYFVEQGD